MTETTILTLMTRPGCHLCDDMRAVIAVVQRTRAIELREIDISTDRALERRYGHDIPVLCHGERGARIIAKHRVTEAELVQALATI